MFITAAPKRLSFRLSKQTQYDLRRRGKCPFFIKKKGEVTVKHRYTIASLRSEVFKVLDEYSFNGQSRELFSGGTEDMNKRFVSALNCAIRLIDASGSRPKKHITLCFKKPEILMELCDIRLYESSKDIDIPYLSGAFSFDFCGRGKLLFVDESANTLEEKELSSEYGVFENARVFVPKTAYKAVFETDKAITVTSLKSYDVSSVGGCDSTELLPDGRRLYCSFPQECAELSCVFSLKGLAKINVPCDIFAIGNGTVSCDEKYAGLYEVGYCEYPKDFCESDGDDTALALSPMAYSAAIYATAASLCEHEDSGLYSKLTYKYREILANTYPHENLCTKNSFFSGGLFGRRRKGHDFRR